MKPLVWATLAAVILGLTACGASEEAYEDEGSGEYAEAADEDRSVSREDALDRAASMQAGMTYEDLGEPYGCTDDCSGHEAGVAWAEANDVRDPSDCGGRSQSFIEGCLAYAEAVQQEAHVIEARGY